MNKYEILYIIRAGIEDDQKNAVVEKYEALANSLGTVTELDKWGLRKFAYVMDKQTEGYYILFTFYIFVNMLGNRNTRFQYFR